MLIGIALILIACYAQLPQAVSITLIIFGSLILLGRVISLEVDLFNERQRRNK